MRLESIVQLIQSMPSGKSVQRSARLLGVFALMIVSLKGFAAADDSADDDAIITPCDPFMVLPSFLPVFKGGEGC